MNNTPQLKNLMKLKESLCYINQTYTESTEFLIVLMLLS